MCQILELSLVTAGVAGDLERFNFGGQRSSYTMKLISKKSLDYLGLDGTVAMCIRTDQLNGVVALFVMKG